MAFFSLLAKKFPAISKGLNLKLLQGSMPPDPPSLLMPTYLKCATQSQTAKAPPPLEACPFGLIWSVSSLITPTREKTCLPG